MDQEPNTHHPHPKSNYNNMDPASFRSGSTFTFLFLIPYKTIIPGFWLMFHLEVGVVLQDVAGGGGDLRLHEFDDPHNFLRKGGSVEQVGVGTDSAA